MLSSESSAEPGKWSTSRAEYQRGIMDAINEPGVQRVVVMSSAQVGKTEIINNTLGFHIDHDPCPILVLQPTLEMADAWSKDRLAPMLRDTPCLNARVSGDTGKTRGKDSDNTIRHKTFPGGQLTVVGANSPAGLAMRPIRVVLADEVDRYPPSAGAEGDPLELAIKRTTTFWNRRVIEVSTPTIKGFSRIEHDFARSDQRRYFVQCPHCGHEQFLKWSQVRWPAGTPELAKYHCESCDEPWTESQRRLAIKNGAWQATATSPAKIVGFHICELYSPWATMGTIATSFEAAQTSVERRKTWVNTVLGEPYEQDAEKIDHHTLARPERHDDWGGKVPNEVLLITCGVDVQADRFEIEKVGWGKDEESWSLDHHTIWGDPSDPGMWRELDAYLMLPTERQDGRELRIRTTCIDSGGHHTQAVYKFCRPRRARRIYAIKGMAGVSVIWPPERLLAKSRLKNPNVIMIGVDAAKDAVYTCLRVTAAGAGYCHFPKGRNPVWFEQLTSEIVVTVYTKGFPKRTYQLPEGKRNEALDCRVYAYAALQSMNVKWGTEAGIVNQSKPAPTPVASSLDVAEMPRPHEIASAAERGAAPARSNPRFTLRPRGNWIGGARGSFWDRGR